MYLLTGRNVLVTGGSRGLGASICERFAEKGANVAVNYNASPDQGNAVANKLKSLYNVKAYAIQGDVSSEQGCIDLIKKSKEALGGLDIIISNAGWTKFADFGDLYSTNGEDWDRIWNTNVKANLFLLREAKSTFEANPDGGVMIVTSSTAGLAPGGSSLPYSVSKAALNHLVKGLAFSQGPKIRVNSVCPGLMLTEWGQNFGNEKLDALKQAAKLQKHTDVDECASLFVTMAEASTMTGVITKIDAGLSPIV